MLNNFYSKRYPKEVIGSTNEIIVFEILPLVVE